MFIDLFSKKRRAEEKSMKFFGILFAAFLCAKKQDSPMLLKMKKSKQSKKEEAGIMKKFEVIEDNAGSLTLMVYADNRESVEYVHNGYESIPGALKEDMEKLKIGADPVNEWDHNLLDDSNLIASVKAYRNADPTETEFWFPEEEKGSGWEVVADNRGYYEERMGASAKQELYIDGQKKEESDITYNEAISELEAQVLILEGRLEYNREFEPKNDNKMLITQMEVAKCAVKAIKEAQELANYGTCEEIIDLLRVISESADDVDENGISVGLIRALVEFAHYKKIGSLKEAMELQKYGTLENIRDACERLYHSRYAVERSGKYPYQCPACNGKLELGYKHCIHCGQFLKYKHPEKD